MSIVAAALTQVERRLPKIIDVRAHGLMDDGQATVDLGMALVWRKGDPQAGFAALLTGSSVLVQSLLRVYALGLTPVLSFATRGSLDAGSAPFSHLIRTMYGFERTTASAVFKTNAFVEAAIVGLTDF